MKLKLKVSLGKGLKWQNKRNSGNLTVNGDLKVGQLMFKIRLQLSEVPPECALYLWFDQQHLACNSDSVLSLFDKHSKNGVLYVLVLRESTFGMLDQRFEKASIQEMKTGTAWILKITYSYYGLYSYTDCFVYDSMEKCIRKLMLERCHNTIEIKNKNAAEVKVDPD